LTVRFVDDEIDEDNKAAEDDGDGDDEDGDDVDSDEDDDERIEDEAHEDDSDGGPDPWAVRDVATDVQVEKEVDGNTDCCE
jgi:hypothetical protein